MDDKNINNQKEIIQKCIDGSYETSKKSFYFGWTNLLYNLKDSLIYNFINLNYKFTPYESPSNVHLYCNKFNMLDKNSIYLVKRELKKILYISYRNNYKPQKNIKNNNTYTSDCGWGCMIRSSQMLFAKILFEIFKQKSDIKNDDDQELLIKQIIPFFMDNNLILNGIYYHEMDNYINKLKYFLHLNNKNNQIISVDPPFSIHKICIIGEIYGRTCGEWFSDFELPKIYNIINNVFDIIPDLNIYHFNSDIELFEIINNCFTPIQENNGEEIETLLYEDGKKYLFKKMGAIFVSVRLGINNISSEYFHSIKQLFDCKQFVGFIGGKKYAASYFIGYMEDDLLFLNPHYNQASINNLSNDGLNTYLNGEVYKLPFSSLQTAFTIGFLFRSNKEFEDLKKYFKKVNEQMYPCFHVKFTQHQKGKQNENNSYINKQNNENEF